MRALHILAVVLLVLLLIGQVRVGSRARFNAGGFSFGCGWGNFGSKFSP